jgi:hypothetical protein
MNMIREEEEEDAEEEDAEEEEEEEEAEAEEEDPAELVAAAAAAAMEAETARTTQEAVARGNQVKCPWHAPSQYLTVCVGDTNANPDLPRYDRIHL